MPCTDSTAAKTASAQATNGHVSYSLRPTNLATHQRAWRGFTTAAERGEARNGHLPRNFAEEYATETRFDDLVLDTDDIPRQYINAMR